MTRNSKLFSNRRFKDARLRLTRPVSPDRNNVRLHLENENFVQEGKPAYLFHGQKL